MNKIKIKEIFTSIQGEGEFVGYNQLFIRFCGCNLNCAYCDTDFKIDENCLTYSIEEFIDLINSTKNIHSVSLTGGEPLLYADFLNLALKNVKKKIYLETNGTLFKELPRIIKFTDYICMDLKLNSCCGCGDLFLQHKKFIEVTVLNKKQISLKVVFDEKITDFEIQNCLKLASKHNLTLILQPKMNKEKLGVPTPKILEIFEKFNSKHENVRLIPQIHKFLNIE